MAVPSLPANLANGAVLPESWTDDVRAMFDFLRNDRPILVVRMDPATQTITTGSTQIIDISGTAPEINQGTFVAGVNGWDAPETGKYLIGAGIRYDSTDGDGSRWVRIYVEGSELGDGFILPAGASTVNPASVQYWYIASVTAGEEIDVRAYQNSGSSLAARASLFAVWLTS